MSTVILSKTYSEPPIIKKELLRYAGCFDADEKLSTLVDECIKEASDKLVYKVCFAVLTVKLEGEICDLGVLKLSSQKLADNLAGCEKAVVFAATVGIGIDRLIAKYGSISPSKALMLQAFGAERIEALCDEFCSDIKNEYGVSLSPRFSPGYGDLAIDSQKDIFSVLDPEKKIGLTLNGSLLMSPSKSVTAIFGLKTITE